MPTRMPNTVIGVDLGGTAIKLGLVTETGKIVKSMKVETPQPSYPEPVLATIVEAIATLDPHRQGTAIGLGVPGPADKAGRIAQVSINLEGWQQVPVADVLEAQTQRPTIAENDANCAGLGEAWLGAGRDFQDWILLTLGTGVGGAIFLNGQLFTGRTGAAGELGLITLDPKGPPCNSGNRGSLEQHCSILALRRDNGMGGRELDKKAREGDKAAIAAWQHYGQLLGAGIASYLYLLTPEAIVLGGGLSTVAELFLPALKAEVETRVMPASRENLQILTATLGNQAGLIGAARLALTHFYG
ncbi:MAG: ROK family protein [Cyanobacteria bacterium P01_G01_bin.38]